MQCLRPIKAGFDRFGNITYSNRSHDKSIESFAFPCRKCLPCRLNYAREKAIRCIHEAKMHKENIFLTLTYNEENLPKDQKLNYLDIQLFIKRLRKNIEKNITDKDLKEKLRIGYICTGEYGDKNKRPHWHLILFNYKPHDAKYKYTSKTGEKVFSSVELTKLWGKGNLDFGSVSLESAGYVARYAAKKLAHGKDQDHHFQPIHKTSSKHAIGKKYLEKYYENIFDLGYIVLPNYQKAAIPRYYEDWLKKNHPEKYIKYFTTLKEKAKKLASEKQLKEDLEYIDEWKSQKTRPLTKKEINLTLLKQKFKQLQERLKL